MADLYAELIANINSTVDGVENGNIKVATARNANTAVYANIAGNAESATYADWTDNAPSADHAIWAKSINELLSFETTCTITKGAGSCKLAEGVYMAVFQDSHENSTSSYYHDISGVLVVNPTKAISWTPTCNCSAGRAAIKYDYAEGKVMLCMENGLVFSSRSGTLNFYKLGTLQEKV